MSKRRQYAQESTYMFFANMLMCRDKFEGGTYLEKLTDRFAYLHDRFRLWGHAIGGFLDIFFFTQGQRLLQNTQRQF